MSVYIQGTSCISPQSSFLSEGWQGAPVNYDTRWLSCIEPVYKDHINPTLARRLSRYIKMGVTTALTALKDANECMPQAIITGTGLGSTEDNEKILLAMYENQERMINPTHFIQSTHNTISSQIAIMLKCHHYNNTYVHRGFSFESALLDGMLLIAEGKSNTALIGGVDAITEGHYVNYARINRWKANTNGSLQMLSTPGTGVIPGEGSAHFVIAKEKTAQTYAAIKALEMLYKPESTDKVTARLRQMLTENHLAPNDIDLVILGNCGEANGDHYYEEIAASMFPATAIGHFKHLCGEYETASAFALWLAATILKTQHIPEGVLQQANIPSSIKNIVIYNHHRSDQHSLYLLERV